MKRKRSPWIAVVVTLLVPFAAAAAARAGDCPSGPDARERPGNDDVFVLLDSSLSMGPTSFGPWARGYTEPAREVLLHLVDCYLQPGDFVLVGTFDSEARIEIAKEITATERDLDTLREQIRALGPSRPRYWDRRSDGARGSERATGGAGHPILGGSLRTDLGEALGFARRTLETYASPDHRQLVLLFTDGEHDPPEFSRFRSEEIDLESFLPRHALVRHRLGLVALPDENGEVAPELAHLIERWDPEGEARSHGEMALIELEAGAPLERQIAHLTEEVEWLLSMRIDLLSPESLDLGAAVRPRIDHALTIANRSRAPRTIEIADAVWVAEGSGIELPLSVEPRRFEIPAEGRARIRVTGELGGLPRGAFRGRVRFRFGSAAVFTPAEVEVRGTRLSWLQAYGHWLALGLLGIAALVGAVALYRRRGIWIAMTWSDGTRTERSVPTKLRTGKAIRFGGRGHGGLVVDGPGRRLGAVRRPAANRFLLEWDGRTRAPEDGAETVADGLVPGRPQRVPDHPDETVTFLLQFDRKQLERNLDALAPRRDDRPEDAGSLLDSTHF